MNKLKLSDKGIALIHKCEGFLPRPEVDELSCNKRIQIGFGFTWFFDENGIRQDVKLSDPEITLIQAANMLKKIIVEFEIGVNELVTAPITQNQFDALVIFAYNEGVPNFASSTLLHKINIDPNSIKITLEFEKWIYETINGRKVVSNGLINRRNAEVGLYWSKS